MCIHLVAASLLAALDLGLLILAVHVVVLVLPVLVVDELLLI